MRVELKIAAVVAMITTPAALSAAGPGRQNPYSSLFSAQLNAAPRPTPPAVQPGLQVPQLMPPQHASRSKVVCGLTIVDGDSKVDSAIGHKAPQDGSKAVLTVIEPQMCRR